MHAPPPSITSREQFQSELSRAIELAQADLKANPSWKAMQLIRQRLAEMRQSTRDGGSPTSDEQRRMDLGLTAVRELDESEELSELCCRLDYYFRSWPMAGG